MIDISKCCPPFRLAIDICLRGGKNKSVALARAICHCEELNWEAVVANCSQMKVHILGRGLSARRCSLVFLGY